MLTVVDKRRSASGIPNADVAEGEKSVAMVIVNDTIDELDETFRINLQWPSVPFKGETTVTILENDLHVSVVDADPVTEGDVPFVWPITDQPTARFRVTISSERPNPVSIPWRVTTVSPPLMPATPGSDFSRPTTINPAIDSWLVFNPEETEAFIEIPIIGDRLCELTEHFNLDIAAEQLHHITHTVVDARGLDTIIDNDPYPILEVNDVTVEEDLGSTMLTVTMTNRSSFPVSFNWAVTDQTAQTVVQPFDYGRLAATGTTIIPAGGGPGPHLEQFVFTIENDFETEPDETFRLTISNAVNANITKATGVVTILANDPRVDIDVDSNNNGTITGADDPIEMDAPGKFVPWNRDDDDDNGQPDYLDAGPLAAADNDLIPVNLAFIQNGLPQSKLEKLRVRISGNTGHSQSGYYAPGSIKLWDSVTKNNLIEPETTWQATAVPSTLFMESVSSSGAAGLVLVLEEIDEESGAPGYSVSLVHFDYVQVSSISLDLDIDSDNSNGFNWPDNSEWEEFLEDNPYALGKLVMQNMYTPNPAQNFTPMRLRLSPGLDLNNTNLRIRLDFEAYSDAGVIALWTTTMADPNRSPMDVTEAGHLISNGTLYTLSQLNYDPIGGGITIFIAGVLENTAIKTMRGVELFGKPQEHVQATLVHSAGGSSIDIFSDRVKYIVTQEDSFFYALQWDVRVLQGLSASLIYDRIDSIDFCMELMGDQELQDTGVENQSIRGMLTERDLASGFNAGLYRHYLGTPTFEYVAAFAGTEPEFPDILTDLMQGIGLTTTQYRNAMDIGNYFKTQVAEIQIRLTNTGHSLGGGLASAAYVGGGARAVTFNSAGLTVAQLFDFYPTSNPNPGPIERIPGSYSRYQNPLMVDAYYVANHDLLSFLQDITPLVLPSALGNRFPLNGPYHVDGVTTVALSAIAAATFPSINTFWPLALAVAGTDGMIGSHFRSAYLYGSLVTEDGNGNILQDLFGYSGVVGSGY